MILLVLKIFSGLRPNKYFKYAAVFIRYQIGVNIIAIPINSEDENFYYFRFEDELVKYPKFYFIEI